MWLTETGGVVRFARSFGYDERRAARSTRHVLTDRRAPEGAARLPLPVDGRADRRRGGTRASSPPTAARGPALNVVEAYLRKPLTPLPPIPRVPRFPRPPDAPPDTGGVEAPPAVG